MSKMKIAKPMNPPYYAVIFTSLKTDSDDGYNEMSSRMLEFVWSNEITYLIRNSNSLTSTEVYLT